MVNYDLDEVWKLVDGYCDSNGFTATETSRDGPWTSGEISINIDIRLKHSTQYYENMRIELVRRPLKSYVHIGAIGVVFAELNQLIEVIDLYLQVHCANHPNYDKATRTEPFSKLLAAKMKSSSVYCY